MGYNAAEYDKIYYREHKEKLLLQRKRNREADPEKYKAYAIKHSRELRAKVIAGYGGQCNCCSEHRLEFLAINHVHGGGAADRRSGRQMLTLCRDIVREDYPSEYNILCHNCNMSVGLYGYCPHQMED